MSPAPAHEQADSSIVPAEIHAWCETEDHGPIVDVQPLHGGQISLTRRVICASGYSFVLKTLTSATSSLDETLPVPADLYRRETEGLGALAGAARLRVPDVYLVSDEFLALEDLGSAPPTKGSFELAGRRLALQHRCRRSRFGFDTDNYLGLLAQRNPWTDDGHTFFAQHRILRYLEVPRCFEAIPSRDRGRLERLAARLPELIPEQPACLIHGDLWHANMLTTPAGEPAVVDPAVYYGWPEAELSMVLGCGQVPDEFFGAYLEINPFEPGWRDRGALLHVREVLSMIAHFGAGDGLLGRLIPILDRFG